MEGGKTGVESWLDEEEEVDENKPNKERTKGGPITSLKWKIKNYCTISTSSQVNYLSQRDTSKEINGGNNIR